jgi:hypothetical protein
MDSDTRTTRWLGAAFLAQFTTSVAAAVFSAKVVAGGAGGALAAAAGNLQATRAAGLMELLTAAGIAGLTALLFETLSGADRSRALVAQALWFVEIGLLSVSGLGLYALAAVGAQVAAGGSATALAAVGTLAFSIYQTAFTAHMLFFCLGAPLWYLLLCRSGIVPRWLARWGLIASLPLLPSMLLTLWDRSLSLGILPGLAYAPFELVVGLWLVATAGRTVAERKAAKSATTADATAPANLKGALS